MILGGVGFELMKGTEGPVEFDQDVVKNRAKQMFRILAIVVDFVENFIEDVVLEGKETLIGDEIGGHLTVEEVLQPIHKEVIGEEIGEEVPLKNQEEPTDVFLHHLPLPLLMGRQKNEGAVLHRNLIGIELKVAVAFLEHEHFKEVRCVWLHAVEEMRCFFYATHIHEQFRAIFLTGKGEGTHEIQVSISSAGGKDWQTGFTG